MGDSGYSEDDKAKAKLDAAIIKAQKVAAMMEHRSDLGSAVHYRVGLTVESVDVLYDLASLKYGGG